jgi:hypothetical protein
VTFRHIFRLAIASSPDIFVGFFFKEWLKQEQERQEADRRERKKTKELKRTAKLERRKQRRALKGGSAVRLRPHRQPQSF